MSRAHPVVGGEGEGEVPGPADPLSFSTEVEVLPPVVSVFVPPRNSLSGNGNSKSSLICQATDFSPKQISLSWFRDGRRMVTGISEGQVETVQSSPVTFRAYSVLTITESDWLSQSVYTCQVDHAQVCRRCPRCASCFLSLGFPERPRAGGAVQGDWGPAPLQQGSRLTGHSAKWPLLFGRTSSFT